MSWEKNISSATGEFPWLGARHKTPVLTLFAKKEEYVKD